MEFFDCNCSFGRPAQTGKSPKVLASADDLRLELNRAGISRAVCWHIAQADVSPVYGNEALAEAISPQANLFGAWTLLPPQTGEMPVDALLRGMKKSRIVALRALPSVNRYVLNTMTMGPVLDEMLSRHIPLVYSVRRNQGGVGERGAWQNLYDLLDDYPELVLIITDHGPWGTDRYFRPLLENFPNVHVDTSLYFLDGGMEDLVERYGHKRILYGSGLPERFPGGPMLAIRHGQFSEEAKAAIASGNLEAIVREVRL
jgi:predicted TIM-barrel fold metal-dependent hydrolase